MAEPSSTPGDHGLLPRDDTYDIRTGAKALVTSASKVLLIKERHADGSPFWTLPGGGVHPTEAQSDGLERELVEELNCSSRVGTPVTQFCYVHDSLESTVSVYTVYETALLSDPVPDTSEGIYDCRWVDPARLPHGTLPQVRHVCRNVVDLPSRSMLADD